MSLKWIFTCLLCAAIYLLLPRAQAIDNFKERCLAFMPETYVHNITRTVLEYVPSGTTLVFPDNDPSCARPNQLVSLNLCRIALSIPTSNTSSITFELWLPENWSGRILATGNGGIDGCIKYDDLAYTTLNGFASVGSNNGHNGTSGIAFYHNPDVVTDFAWRALHVSVTIGKELVKQFYDKLHNKSYYLGCSLGGRQGIKAAEKFPDDFDGIVAGAPALDFNNLASWRASFFPITGAIGSPNFISASTWTSLIHDEILRQCDGLDGVIDGIMEDPNLCDFHPETLFCANVNSTGNCLTSIQVEMVRKIFSPLYGEDGNLIYPAMQPGSEIMAVNKLYAGKPFSYSEDWFRYVILSDPSWNASTFTLGDAALASSLNPSDIRTWPTSASLLPFRQSGGKILAYHGGQDNQITSFESERFYWRLRLSLNASSSSTTVPSSPDEFEDFDLADSSLSSPAANEFTDSRNFIRNSKFRTNFDFGADYPADVDELDSWFRLFRVPGMFHCNSGPGAWVMGQGGGEAAEGVPFVAEWNVLAAVVEWVEGGRKPEWIGGVRFAGDDGGSGAGRGVVVERRHCRYPYRHTYTGGNASLASSWTCL